MRKQILTVMMATLMVCAFVGTASANSYFNSKSSGYGHSTGQSVNSWSGASSDGQYANAYGHADALGIYADAETGAEAYNDVPFGAGASAGSYASGNFVVSDSEAGTDGIGAGADSSAEAYSLFGGVDAESVASAQGIFGATAYSESSAEKGHAESESSAGTLVP